MCGEDPLLNWTRTFEHCEKPLENNFRDSNEKVQGSNFCEYFCVWSIVFKHNFCEYICGFSISLET
jgi:hypothetical protein